MRPAAICSVAAGLVIASLGWAADAPSLTVVERTPSRLVARLSEFTPGLLYRVTYQERPPGVTQERPPGLGQDGKRGFVWENLSPDAAGTVILTDDKYLRPEYRLRCQSRLSHGDPVVFDDSLKGPVLGKRRAPFGVPVSSFGGAGYLVPGVSDLKRDDFGSFWLYLDHLPYALLKYDAHFRYQLALLTSGPVLAHDLDADGNLYLLHPGNWISKHSPVGEALGAWELPRGRGPGEFIAASGLVIDRRASFLYLSDERLGRVQRFDLDLRLRPMPQVAWGWIGREDLAYTKAGQYDSGSMYYQLDRPRQLALDSRGNLYVSCEHYISKFDLATGRQVQFGEGEPLGSGAQRRAGFGKFPVLGWGGSFTDSPFSPAAALDGHWQRQWLAGVDASGNVYVSDRENEFVSSPRLQVFAPDGTLAQCLPLQSGLSDASGRPVYVGAVMGLAVEGDSVWMTDAAGHIYAGPPGQGLRGGGRLFLGPGAAGRQFDLAGVEEREFTVEAQSGRVRHRSEGPVLGFPAGEKGTGNCEREGRPVLNGGERSMWLVTRLGEPFTVKLFDSAGAEIPSSSYAVEYEDKPGLFGTEWDYFRVTNRSGAVWRNVRFVAEAQ